MRYERRPAKPVHYLGVIRAIPAVEQRVLRSHFGRARHSHIATELTEHYRARFSDIMQRPYQSAEVISSSRYAVRRCRAASAAYSVSIWERARTSSSSFCTFCKKRRLDPSSSIEEVEVGLHPQALIRLAKHLQEVTHVGSKVGTPAPPARQPRRSCP